MVNAHVTLRPRAVRRLALLAVAGSFLVTPSHAAAFPLPDRYAVPPIAETPECPPRSARGADFPLPTRAGVRRLVEEFVDSYNSGDLLRLEGLFAQKEDFRWYFVAGERTDDAKERETLLPYFARRHAMGDRLRLMKLDVARRVGWHGGYDFSVKLRRTSDEARARGVWHGKAAADCAIFTWSLGRD